MNTILKLSILILLICINSSCTTNDSIAPESVVVTDVFAVGYESDGVNNIGKYWKNGEPTSLTDGANNAIVTSVFVTTN